MEKNISKNFNNNSKLSETKVLIGLNIDTCRSDNYINDLKDQIYSFLEKMSWK